MSFVDYGLYSLISIYIAWIWIDFYRLIDIFEREDIKHILIMFVLGGLSVFLVFGAQYLFLNELFAGLKGTLVYDFIYCTLRIGAVEELAKLSAFWVFMLFFSNECNEPIDYLIYLSVSALGFAAFENVLYFAGHGPTLIAGRSILSTIGHMFDTSLIAYGIILYKYREGYGRIWVLFQYFGYAALAHGIYDFWLMYEPFQSFGFWLTILYFFFTISIFATILSNAINNSAFFSYKKTVDQNKVIFTLFKYYGILQIIQFIMISYKQDVKIAIAYAVSTLFTTGFIIVITCVRLSRFKLILNRWHKLKLELPFSINNGSNLFGLFSIKIKGDSSNEVQLSGLYQEYLELIPISPKSSFLIDKQKAYISEKHFTDKDESFYAVKVFFKGIDEYVELYIQSKKTGKAKTKNGNQIVALMQKIGDNDVYSNALNAKELSFIEWAVVNKLQQ